MKKGGKGKSFIEKLKTSPAAKVVKEQGLGAAIKTGAKYAKEDMQDLADKAMDTIFPGDTTHMQTRVGHFNAGATEHQKQMVVRKEDLPHAGSIADTFHEQGENPAPFRQGNVSSIMNGFQIRERKSPPEGY